VCESLDCGRRTDAKRGDKAKRIVGNFRGHSQNGADKKRDWPVDCAIENSGMSHGADRTLVPGKLRVVSMNVNRLDDAGKCDQ